MPNRSEPQSEFVATSFAYPVVSAERRAHLTDRIVNSAVASRRLATAGINGFALCTCLRIEVIVQGGNAIAEKAHVELFGVPDPGGRVRLGTEAIDHAFRVAAGLDSPMIGEHEVLSQFRTAVTSAKSVGAVDGDLMRLLDAAVATGRAARVRLPEPGSLADVAADAADLDGPVAVFGAGAMARGVAAALRQRNVLVDMYARRPDGVQPMDGVTLHDMDDAREAMSSARTIISATSAKYRLFSEQELRSATASRADDLTLIDMAMPPDFDGDAPNVHYVGIDALADRLRSQPAQRDVEAFVADAAAQIALKVANHQRSGPVIAGILSAADQAVLEEVERFAGRLTFSGDREIFEQLARTVARRVLHPAVSYLSGADDGSEVAVTFAKAFGLDDA